MCVYACVSVFVCPKCVNARTTFILPPCIPPATFLQLTLTLFVNTHSHAQTHTQVGGIPNDELNGLEIEMLFLLNFSLHTKRRQYDEFLTLLRQRQVEMMKSRLPIKFCI